MRHVSVLSSALLLALSGVVAQAQSVKEPQAP